MGPRIGTDALDLPDADTVYARYLERCRRLGVEPVLRAAAADQALADHI